MTRASARPTTCRGNDWLRRRRTAPPRREGTDLIDDEPLPSHTEVERRLLRRLHDQAHEGSPDTDAQIAERLSLTEEQVGSHLRGVYKELDLPDLTETERRMVFALCQPRVERGHAQLASNREIAEAIGLRENTVKAYLRDLFRKVGLDPEQEKRRRLVERIRKSAREKTWPKGLEWPTGFDETEKRVVRGIYRLLSEPGPSAPPPSPREIAKRAGLGVDAVNVCLRQLYTRFGVGLTQNQKRGRLSELAFTKGLVSQRQPDTGTELPPEGQGHDPTTDDVEELEKDDPDAGTELQPDEGQGHDPTTDDVEELEKDDPDAGTEAVVNPGGEDSELPVLARAARMLGGGWQWLREHPAVLAVALVGALAILAVTLLITRPLDQTCSTATELRVLTSADKEGAIRKEADDYMGDHEDDGCRTVNANVTAAPTSRPVIEALRNHWRRWDEDALGKVGPQPDVWLPESSVDVEQVEQGADSDGPRISREGSIASAPLVLASTRDRLGSVPASDRARLHELETVRTNPESSTAGLLATGALYEAAPDNDVARRRLERDVPIVGNDPRALLCPFRLTDQGRWRQSAFVVPANVLTDFNERRPLGGPCARTAPPTTQAQIQPIEFHADDPIVLDHPCLLLSPREPPGDQQAQRHEDERRQASRSFCRYLQEQGQRVLKDHGFAPPSNAPSPIDPKSTLDRWRDARLPGRVLLGIDVSGSMKLPLPPTGREHRIDAAVAAAGEALRLVGGNDTLGLWAFNDAHSELERPNRATEPHRKRLQHRLEGLRPAGGTRLYDTIAAAVEQLEADSRKDAISALVILTDGEDHGSDLSEQQLSDQLDRADEKNKRVRVFMITFLGGRCARLSNLTPAFRGGCFEATSEGELTDVFRTVFASFGRGTQQP